MKTASQAVAAGGMALMLAAADAPTLHVSTLPDHQFRLAWPRSTTGYLVEEATSLSPPVAWVTVPRNPVVDADLHTLTLEPEAGTRFFRLRFGLPPCPPEGTPAPLAALQITEVGVLPTPGGYPWVELRHVGRCGNVALQRGLHVRNRTNVLRELRSGELAPGQFLLIVCDDPLEDGEPMPDEWIGDPANPAGRILHAPRKGARFDPVADECVLGWTEWGRDWQLQEDVISSVKWGNNPERGNTLNTAAFPLYPGGSIGLDGLDPGHWVRYQTPTPGSENGLPAPVAYYPFDGSKVPTEDVTPFAWLDFQSRGVDYRLQVDDSAGFDSPLVDVVVPGTSHDVQPSLPVGQYHWRVRSETASGLSAWSIGNHFTIVPALPGTGGGALDTPGVLRATPGRLALAGPGPGKVFPPSKDTKMVCMECRAENGAHAWDQAHDDDQARCDHALWYETVNAIHIVNLMYGGALAQDQIAWHAFGSSAGGPIDPAGRLGHGVSFPREHLQTTLEWALGGDNTVRTYAGSFLTASNALAWNGELRVYVGEYWARYLGGTYVRSELFVATGGIYREEALDELLLTAHDARTGKSIYIPWSDVTAAWVPDDSVTEAWGTALEGDESTAADLTDADGDGLLAVDEALRFGTDPQKADTDDDGVPDKVEIYSYRFGKGIVPRTPDIDGDGSRAELDDDSDDDGCLDGEEDLNRNGKYRPITLVTMNGVTEDATATEDGETDPFWDDEIKLSLHAEKTKLEFKQCTTVTVELLQNDGTPWTNRVIHLTCDPPTLGYFKPLQEGSVEGPEILVTTDENGRGRAEFCTFEEQGPAKIKAAFERCEGAEDTVKEQTIEIQPYSCILAIQERAVLTGPLLDSGYSTRKEVGVMWYTGTGFAAGNNSISKDVRSQRLLGHFYHPHTREPGRSIQSIQLGQLHSAIADKVTLLVDGEVAPSREWTRRSSQDNPTTWEVRIAATNLAEAFIPDKMLPRYLHVRAGAVSWREPLLWWWSCTAYGSRSLYVYSCGQSPGVWGELFEEFDRERITKRVLFFFGDSSLPNGDDAYGHLWPTQPNTGVGFIPIGTVAGYPVGPTVFTGRSSAPCTEDSGVFAQYHIFSEAKKYAWFSLPAETSTTSLGQPPLCLDELACARTYGAIADSLRARIASLGPVRVEPLPDNVAFQRDYLEEERIIMGNYGFEVPSPHVIVMRNGESAD